MLEYIMRRMIGIVPTLVLVSIIIFILLELAPGDAADALIPPDLGGEAIVKMRQKLGLDQPVYIRYLKWLGQAVRGNLGYSFSTKRPVIEMIAERLPATLELVLSALILSTVMGIGLGVISALKEYSVTDNVLTFFGMAGISIPPFFLGVLGIFLLSARLGWFPVGGRVPIGEINFWTRLHHLFLPALVLGIYQIAAIMRYTRSSMIETLNQPYVATAFSKGEPKRYVYAVHAFRNACIPVLIVLMFRIVTLFGGSLFIETVFSWPGMGTLMMAAINNRDYPLVLAILLIMTTVVLIVSLMVDVVTAIVDPRIRFE